MTDMPFRFADYTPDELREILKLDLKARHAQCEPAAATSGISLKTRPCRA